MPTIAEILAQQEEEEESPIQQIVRQAREEEERAARLVAQSPLGRLQQASNRFFPDMMEAAEDTVDVLSHPLEFSGRVGSLAKQGVNKAIGQAQELITGQEMPEDMPGFETGDINQVGRKLKESFGTPEAALNTVAEHPFDTLAALHGGGVTTMPNKVKPISGLLKGGRNTVDNMTTQMYRKDMNIPPSLLEEGDAIAAFGKQQGIAPTKRGLKKINKKTDELNQELNTMVGEQTDKLNLIPISVVTKELNALKKDFVGAWNETKAIKVIDQKLDELNALYGQRPGLTAQELHKLKTTAYETAYRRTAEGKRGTPKERTDRQGARGAKEALEQRMPDYGPINKKWGAFAKLKPYVENRVNAAEQGMKGELLGTTREILKKMLPGGRAAIVLNKLTDIHIPQLLSKYTPQQVKYMASKVNADNLAATLWANGQFDELLELEDE